MAKNGLHTGWFLLGERYSDIIQEMKKFYVLLVGLYVALILPYVFLSGSAGSNLAGFFYIPILIFTVTFIWYVLKHESSLKNKIFHIGGFILLNIILLIIGFVIALGFTCGGHC